MVIKEQRKGNRAGNKFIHSLYKGRRMVPERREYIPIPLEYCKIEEWKQKKKKNTKKEKQREKK